MTLTVICSPNRNRPDCNTRTTIVKGGGREGQLLASVPIPKFASLCAAGCADDAKLSDVLHKLGRNVTKPTHPRSRGWLSPTNLLRRLAYLGRNGAWLLALTQGRRGLQEPPGGPVYWPPSKTRTSGGGSPTRLFGTDFL